MRNDNTIQADLEYALRMVRGGFATVQQAAQACGVPVAVLQRSIELGAAAAARHTANSDKAKAVITHGSRD